jgi:hypothetical protein
MSSMSTERARVEMNCVATSAVTATESRAEDTLRWVDERIDAMIELLRLRINPLRGRGPSWC